MRTIVHRGPADKLTHEERIACRRATLGKDGSMRYDLEECEEWPEERQGYTFRLKNKETGYLIGWALVVWEPDGGRQKPIAQFYIKSRYRKQGYGTRLAKLVTGKYGEVEGYGWDPRSRSFFRSLDILFKEP